MDNKVFSIGDAASVLMGVGVGKLDQLYVGLSLIGVGVILKILVVVLNKKGFPVKGK